MQIVRKNKIYEKTWNKFMDLLLDPQIMNKLF